jgi:hypothetical protein
VGQWRRGRLGNAGYRHGTYLSLHPFSTSLLTIPREAFCQLLISAYMSTKREGEERMKPRTRAREGRGFSGVICGLLSQTTWGIEGTKI